MHLTCMTIRYFLGRISFFNDKLKNVKKIQPERVRMVQDSFSSDFGRTNVGDAWLSSSGKHEQSPIGKKPPIPTSNTEGQVKL